jgi:hypothetical protein
MPPSPKTTFVSLSFNMTMKKILSIIFVLTVLSATAQSPVNTGSDISAPDTMRVIYEIPGLKSFEGQYMENVSYLKWTIAGLDSDCLFAIEKSTDDVNFSVCAVKKGIGVPHHGVAILYCASDSVYSAGPCYYRLLKLTEGLMCIGPSLRIDVPAAEILVETFQSK